VLALVLCGAGETSAAIGTFNSFAVGLGAYGGKGRMVGEDTVS
jgi:hypothetical protein